MIETNTGPELETPEQQGSSILGVLGAFLGALLGHGLWLGCMFALPSGSVLWDLIIFGGLFAGFFSCWGYRLFRGRRNMKFAWRVVRLSPQPSCSALRHWFFTGPKAGGQRDPRWSGLPSPAVWNGW